MVYYTLSIQKLLKLCQNKLNDKIEKWLPFRIDIAYIMCIYLSKTRYYFISTDTVWHVFVYNLNYLDL